MARKAKIEIFPGKDGPRVRVRASNGEILATTEAFHSIGNARKAAKRLMRTVAAAEIVEAA